MRQYHIHLWFNVLRIMGYRVNVLESKFKYLVIDNVIVGCSVLVGILSHF